MSTPKKPKAQDEEARQGPQEREREPGSNAVEPEPDPDAEPIADGAHPYIPRSPYTTGNY